ncbi:MAG: 4-(cytidine 5'-diphospho)-2-C-methyl-D-erythritol kinase [Pyrinomonadaceae bacterium]
MKAFTLPSLAKINRFLLIHGKRNDGFHELFTEFQTISLFDEIRFEPAAEFAFVCDSVGTPNDENNLVVKAAMLLAEYANVKPSGRINLKKRIPAPGGLGGGSSNAAISLLGCAKLWGVNIAPETLVSLGAKLGADSPFIFYGGNVFGTGTGTELFAAPVRKKQYLIIITPNVKISTAEAFKRLNLHPLTNTNRASILQICADYADALRGDISEHKNDFENSVFELEPTIKSCRETLLDLGAHTALLSGSGASVFGVFDNEFVRDKAFENLVFEGAKFAAETISVDEYREMLTPCKDLLPKDLNKFGGA